MERRGSGPCGGLAEQPTWVVSRSSESVAPSATLVDNDLDGAVRRLNAGHEGDVEFGGPTLAGSLTELGLIDEYRIYLYPVVLGPGKPVFAQHGRGSVVCLPSRSATTWSGCPTHLRERSSAFGLGLSHRRGRSARVPKPVDRPAPDAVGSSRR